MPEAPTEPTVRIYNRNTTRSFICDKIIVAPSTFTDLPATLAKRLLANYPADLVEGGVAQQELQGAQAENAALKARIAELEAQAAGKGKKSAGKTATPAEEAGDSPV